VRRVSENGVEMRMFVPERKGVTENTEKTGQRVA
jgi:hypothetical protein